MTVDYEQRHRTLRAAITVVLVALCAITVGCDDDPEKRRETIYELRQNPTEENVIRIREALADREPDVRATALNTLVGLRVPDSMELTLAAIEDESAFVRSIAAKLLGDLADPAQTGTLVAQLLEDPDAWVRKTAAESLGLIGGERAIVGLISALQDPIEKVRLAAVTGLRRLDPGRAPDALARLLLEDPSGDVRIQAAAALGISGNPEVVPVLEAALNDDNASVRTAVENAIKRNRALAVRKSAE